MVLIVSDLAYFTKVRRFLWRFYDGLYSFALTTYARTLLLLFFVISAGKSQTKCLFDRKNKNKINTKTFANNKYLLYLCGVNKSLFIIKNSFYMERKSREELELDLEILATILDFHAKRPNPDKAHIDAILDEINRIKKELAQS